MASAPKQNTDLSGRNGKEVLESVEWTPENEVKFFYALRNRRPVGQCSLLCNLFWMLKSFLAFV